MGEYYRSVSSQLWSVIDEEINIRESEIFRLDRRDSADVHFTFSYRPDGTSDPFSESGIIWSLNFFFHNRKLRRILFFTCRADCKTSNNDEENRNEDAFEGDPFDK
jgi:hypothetical protein